MSKIDGNKAEETVTISKREYARLLDSERMLLCLEDAGVDNWGGYSEAMKEFYRGEI